MVTTNAVEKDVSNFEFAVPCAGKVNVANVGEYGRDDAKHHTYTVTVTDGHTTHCTCPADKYHEGACKHRDGVESVPLVLYTASRTVETDGGVTTKHEERQKDTESRTDNETADYEPDCSEEIQAMWAPYSAEQTPVPEEDY